MKYRCRLDDELAAKLGVAILVVLWDTEELIVADSREA